MRHDLGDLAPDRGGAVRDLHLVGAHRMSEEPQNWGVTLLVAAGIGLVRTPEGGGSVDAEQRFAVFYAEHYRLILTVAQQRVGDLTTAQDITSEVFRVAWIHHCDGGHLELPWLYIVLRNIVGHEYRSRARRAEFPADLIDLTGAASPELFDARSDDAVVVREALERLDEADREVLRLAYWEDLTGPEIAPILGCSASSVRKRLERARARLRAVLEPADRADGAGARATGPTPRETGG